MVVTGEGIINEVSYSKEAIEAQVSTERKMSI